VALAEGRAAVLPDPLALKTCGLVADWAAGGAVPAAVRRLVQGGIPVRTSVLLGILVAALSAAGVVIAAGRTDPPQGDDPAARPDRGAAEPAVAAAPDPKGDEKAEGFTTQPKLRVAFDLPVRQAVQVAWSPDGKDLAVRDTRVPKAEADKRVNGVLYYSGLL